MGFHEINKDAKEFLCMSANGADVFVDLENTNIGLHLIENPDLVELAKEAVSGSDLEGEKVALEKDLGRVVGTTSMVEVTEGDEIVYAKRLGRCKYSKFVKNRELKQTSKVVVILFKKKYGYLVWSAWCGELLPQEPDGEGGTRTSREFDRTHALVYDPKIIQPGKKLLIELMIEYLFS